MASIITKQAIQTMIVFAGIAVIPVVTAAVVNAVVGARLAINSGLPTERLEDHVVVVQPPLHLALELAAAVSQLRQLDQVLELQVVDVVDQWATLLAL